MDRPAWVESALATDGVSISDQDLGITYDPPIGSLAGRIFSWIMHKIGVFV